LFSITEKNTLLGMLKVLVKMNTNTIYEAHDDMTIGYVMIAVLSGKVWSLYQKVLEMEEIVEIHPLFGDYDLVATIEILDFEGLVKFAEQKIDTIAEVIKTKPITETKF